MCYKETVVCVLIQVINALDHELVVITSAFENLGIEDIRYES